MLQNILRYGQGRDRAVGHNGIILVLPTGKRLSILCNLNLETNDYLSQYRTILKRAVENSLPTQIDASSDIDITVFKELFEEGLVEAIDASSMDGFAYLDPRITVRGREYLNKLESELVQASWGWKSKRAAYWIFNWFAGVGAGIIVGLIIARC